MATSRLKAPTFLALKALLAPLGYRKSANLFSRATCDVVHLVEVQGSRQSTVETARFTVNIAIFAPDLVYADVRDTTKPSVPRAHWRQRIGALSSEQQDLWWEVSNPEQAASAAQDIATRIERFVLPRLAVLPDLGALVRLWQSGQSPGLTAFQRNEFLARLGRMSSTSGAT
jgi:hypothetical protein